MQNKRFFLLLLTIPVLVGSTVVYARPHHRGGQHGGGNHGNHGYRGQHGGGYHGYRRHHRGPSVGFYFGSPIYSRPYYSYPYRPYYPYYPPTIVTVPVSPPVYIERSQSEPVQPLEPGYWYYCNEPEGYYPYVQECPNGWYQVDPIPAK